MDDDISSSPKSFFQTLPGIITGIAATITALGGLILALNQTGCFGTRKTDKSVSSETSISNDNAKSSTSNIKTDSDKPPVENATAATGSSNPKVTWSKEPVSFLAQQVTFTIKEATIQSLPGNEAFLQVSIKCVNESNNIFNWGPAGLRVKAGEDKFSPDDSSPSMLSSVYPHSFKIFTFNYKLPSSEKTYGILFYDIYEGKELGNLSVQVL